MILPWFARFFPVRQGTHTSLPHTHTNTVLPMIVEVLAMSFFEECDGVDCVIENRVPDYKEMCRVKHNKGHFVELPYRVRHALGTDAAVLLEHLNQVGKSNSDEGGWIMATEKFLTNGIGGNHEEHCNLLEFLKSKGLLKIKFLNGRRFLRVSQREYLKLLGE